MYGGYTWLTNTRPPVHTAERLLLLVAMAGFLTVGLAIPEGFGRAGLELGLGYLLVVIVHSALYFRVNRNIIRITPFNVTSALLVIAAGALAPSAGHPGPVVYALWGAAVALQLGSPLIVHPRGLFELRPAHLVERYSALLMVAIGESVAAVGIGAAGLAKQVGLESGRLWPWTGSWSR
jgi:low temperature requirement protein LtrA